MSQLADLAKPFPDAFISEKPGGFAAKYAEHSLVTQKLLAIVGPFSQTVRMVLREHDTGQITGVVLALTLTIDGREVTVEEVGDVEHPEQKATDGARLKDAVSDAHKRAAMRVGVALDLWGKGAYFLHSALVRRETEQVEAEKVEAEKAAAERHRGLSALHVVVECPVDPETGEVLEDAT